MLQYPWNVPMDKSVAQRDLDYYKQRTDENGPAMTDAIAGIDSSELGSPGCSAYTYLLRSYQPFQSARFNQFHETRQGGAFDFTTAAGGFLQEFQYGFTGLRFGTDSVRINPSLPPQLPGVNLTGLRWHGSTFDIAVEPSKTTLTLRSGPAMPVTGPDGSVQTVEKDKPLTVPTRRPAEAKTDDLARCAEVKTSAQDPNEFGIAAIDGADGTSWKASKPGESLTVDLGATKQVRKVKVRAPSKTTAYTIQGSADGQHWNDLAKQEETTETETAHEISPPASVRYIRYTAGPHAKADVSTLEVK